MCNPQNGQRSWVCGRANGCPSRASGVRILNETEKGGDLQGVFPRIAVLDDDIYDVHVVHDEALRAIRISDCCVHTQSEGGEDSRDEGGVVCYLVEHGMVSAIVHGVKDDFQLDGLCGCGLSDLDNGSKGEIIHVVVDVYKAEVGQRRGGPVGNGGGRV